MGHYTISKLAAELEVSRVWLSEQVKRGVIKGERISKTVFILTEREAKKWKERYAKLGLRAFPRKLRKKKVR